MKRYHKSSDNFSLPLLTPHAIGGIFIDPFRKEISRLIFEPTEDDILRLLSNKNHGDVSDFDTIQLSAYRDVLIVDKYGIEKFETSAFILTPINLMFLGCGIVCRIADLPKQKENQDQKEQIDKFIFNTTPMNIEQAKNLFLV